MKIKNLWVGNVFNVFDVVDGVIMIRECEPSEGPFILRKENEHVYTNLNNGKRYTTKDVFGFDKVEKNSLKPLSEYYKFFLKLNRHSDSCIVHEEIKKLKKAGKI